MSQGNLKRKITKEELLARRLPKDVFCSGPLLEAIQTANIFPSSRDFVMKKLKFPVSHVMSNFYNLTKNFGGKRPAHEALMLFVEENFEEANENESWLPPDWTALIPNFRYIADEKLRTWAQELNTVWKSQCRRTSHEVNVQPDLYSIIPLPHSFILRNPKRSELNYLYAFWIIKGLLLCGMTITAQDMLKNLLYLVKKYGYVPKGNRVYYEGRSNPPMLPIIMEVYLQHTRDFEFIRKNIELIEQEATFFKENRTRTIEKDGIHYEMFIYNVDVQLARPEAYREDVSSGTLADTETELHNHFVSTQSASESGWSFSTRWFVLHGFNHGSRSNTATQYLIPVDLNSFMHRNFTLLKWWYKRIGNVEKSRYYWVLSEELLTAIENVLWNEKVGIWLDYDIRYEHHRNYFYISNFTPLWTKSYTMHPDVLTEKILSYLNAYNMDHYSGGIPASTEFSGEVMDFPNAWPHLQYIFVNGLDKIGTPIASELAFHFADKFIQASYKAYNEHGTIFPAYDCLIPGRYGIGLETQEAFSSELGVIFDFFMKWGHKFHSQENGISSDQSVKSLPLFLIIAIQYLLLQRLMSYFLNQ